MTKPLLVDKSKFDSALSRMLRKKPVERGKVRTNPKHKPAKIIAPQA